MKKICIATYVYGDDYQSFIPIYIYSILKAYPDYDIRIYLDRDLLPNINCQLDLIKTLGNFHIIENFNDELQLKKKMLKNDSIMKSLRWVIYDEAFSKYESIYIGDIDMFICKEEMGIYEQHINHCKYLNLPYSNCIRKSKLEKVNIRKFFYYIIKFGFSETIKYYKDSRKEIKKLTGLHFIKTKEYYDIMLPLLPKQMSMLIDISNNRLKEFNKIMLNDENLLYELIKASGIGLPPESSKAVVNDSKDFNSATFRPHHGLHLGIFRDSQGAQREKRLVLGETYKEYYKQFCKFRETDELFTEIEKEFSPYLKEIINNMDKIYLDI